MAALKNTFVLRMFASETLFRLFKRCKEFAVFLTDRREEILWKFMWRKGPLTEKTCDRALVFLVGKGFMHESI